ncbi:MAG: cupin domain-containing protein [Chloroflexi bacterium]|nr:cupin domain-containing protein [Chloroflexota bacterium]
MPREEAKRYGKGNKKTEFYAESLQEVKDAKKLNETLLKLVKAEEMPWEDSPQGRIKHIVNDRMNVRMKTIDAYILELPPGSRSGKHRHMAEECLYVLEGKGYDLHQDMDFELGDTYIWKMNPEVKRFDWEEGDLVYVPVNTVHQHFNADPKKPARLISATNRAYQWVGFNDLEQIENAPDYKAKA